MSDAGEREPVSDETSVTDRRSRTRKAYRLTRLGRRVLGLEVERLRELAVTAANLLGSESG